ncbi:MAG TPA: efflux transporter outer membrane subunit, partial [Neisseria sp.]|nr:efflux transporter outer membrane subunit [Neisseria sp.]
MKAMKFKPAISAAAVSLALSACAMIPKYEQPAVAVPEAFQHDTAQSGIVAASLGWQDYFADPRLHRLIEIAIERNTDLRGAALNAEAVRAQYMISRAALLPGINASGTGQRGRVAADLSGTGSSYVSSAYNVGLGVTSYELDLFGKVRSTSQAALQSYFASVASRDATHLSLISSVAKAYFNERYAEERMALAQRVLQTREQTYKLTQLRHRAGVISAVDLRQQEALIESAKADYASAVQAREQARNAMAVLLNQPLPADLPAGLPLSRQFAIKQLPAGLSSEVLLNRPDIRAAEFALKRANANIGAARAAFFPSISLTGMIGTGSTELSGLFKGGNSTWTFAPSINLPIFNWGSNVANLDYAKIMQQAEIVNYEAAVQSAFRDVSDALVAREQLDKTYAANAQQSKAYADALRLINLRYRHGVASALDLLDAERSSYAADTTQLATQLTLLENMADLYKALGGGLKQHTETAQ